MGKNSESRGTSGGYDFGTFKGVYTPSVLTILGVVMYLRFGWVLGNVGLLQTLVIVTLSTSITFITGLSLSALATNMKVGGGGAYFMISRSLGLEAGAAVGLPLFFAQALGISFYIAGFSEVVQAEFPNMPLSPAMVGLITLTLLTVLAYISADLALKSQFVVMAVIFTSLVSLFLGRRPEVPMVAPAILEPAQTFWPVFAVFFPAVTGIEAGIAMSGDLKSPEKSLPRGTIGAILTGYAAYIVIPIFLSFVVADSNLLISDRWVMRRVARWGTPVLLGVWAAALSSAMGALLGAPRTLQALAKDHVLPRIFGRGFGKGNDPRIATATAFAVGLAGIMLGDLNTIAPVLSMFFLTSYGLLNISAGLEELTAPPSWRPKFHVAWPVSIIGAFLCFATMFMINPGATFLAAFVSLTVYLLMERRKLKAGWGDMRSGILTMIARYSIHALARRAPDERTWKPNILALCGSPASRWYLVEFAGAISRDRGFLTVAAIVPDDVTADRQENMTRTIADYVDKHDIRALVKVCPAPDPIAGARMLITAYGYGPIAPNTILLGETERPENFRRFAELIRVISHRCQNLVIFRERSEDQQRADEQRIDVWWYGTQQNLGLMLALIQLLKQSPTWQNASVVLKTIVTDAEKQQETRKRLTSFIDRVRIDAQAEVLTQVSDDIFEDIRRLSSGAELVFLGMRAPLPDESIEEYETYYDELLGRTRDLPPVALVLAAEEMDFFSIFQG